MSADNHTWRAKSVGGLIDIQKCQIDHKHFLPLIYISASWINHPLPQSEIKYIY